jgi:hypothetical protein
METKSTHVEKIIPVAGLLLFSVFLLLAFSVIHDSADTSDVD